MQISLKDSIDIRRNYMSEVIGSTEEVLLGMGFKPLNPIGEFICGEDLYTRMLVPPLSHIRPENIDDDEVLKETSKEIDCLYKRKYLYVPRVPKVQKTSTLTAYLIGELCKGNIIGDSFLTASVDRRGTKYRELEIVLPNSDMERGEAVLLKVIGRFVRKSMEFNVNPTWFSWASMAENFRLNGSNQKWGAIGMVREEIISATPKSGQLKDVVMVGIPLYTLAEYIGE